MKKKNYISFDGKIFVSDQYGGCIYPADGLYTAGSLFCFWP
ncbi:hypothetical protein [Schaedlerella arabinosiphila]|nr:hypothetical protein [Schaedlerella arabinosiphila]KAI4439533.1 hypothetical protein C824_002020 [Schaedlerella arabinosiphila]